MTSGRLSLLAALVFVAPRAWGFTVEVGEVATLIDVEVIATALDNAAVLKVVNRDAVPAECELLIDTGPEEFVRRVRVAPSSSRLVTQKIRPNTQRVRVHGSCR